MALLALLAGLLLWLSLGSKALRNRQNWPALGALLIGLIFLAKGKALLGAPIIAAGALWLHRDKLKKRPIKAPSADADLIEACDLLGLTPPFDRTDILAAHRRLIARNHPDNGGTQGLAARLNAARDLLLKSIR